MVAENIPHHVLVRSEMYLFQYYTHKNLKELNSEIPKLYGNGLHKLRLPDMTLLVYLIGNMIAW